MSRLSTSTRSLAPGSRRPRRDLVEQDRVDAVAQAQEAAVRAARAEVDARPREPQVGRVLLHEVGQQRAQAGQALGLVDAEDGAQDHLERDPLHARAGGERPVRGPGRDLGRRDLRHHVGVALDRLAVERRQHELARLQVLGLVEQQQRVVAQRGRQELVGLAGLEHRRVAGEDLLARGRIGRDRRASRTGSAAARRRCRSGAGSRRGTPPAARENSAVWTTAGSRRAGRLRHGPDSPISRRPSRSCFSRLRCSPASSGASGSVGPPGIGSPLYSSGSSTSSPPTVTLPSSWWATSAGPELGLGALA